MNEHKTEGEALYSLIIDYIERTGATRKAVAEALGLTPSLLSKPEQMKSVVTLSSETAVRAKAMFGVEFARARALSGMPQAEVTALGQRMGALVDEKIKQDVLLYLQRIESDLEQIKSLLISK